MKGKNLKGFVEALEELEREKGIEKEKLLETVEIALLAAYKKNYGDDRSARIELNRVTGVVRIYSKKVVVATEDDVKDATSEISLEEARKIDKKIEIGEDLEFEEKCNDFRRNAIQNAKQIIIQKVREAERENIYRKFKDKEHQLINGNIRRIDEKGNVFIELNGVEIMLALVEQSSSDRYIIGNRLKVYVAEVEETSKFPKIVISRKHENFLKEMFKTEVPEIEEGIITIKSIAREAGSRAKIAVYSLDPNVNTVGACIGQKRSRINNIVDELNGEKIDIVNWREDKKEFVQEALSPARVKSVELLDDGMTSKVIVPESQFSLAIGKKGQNARLAAKLTGVRIDIKTEKDEDEE